MSGIEPLPNVLQTCVLPLYYKGNLFLFIKRVFKMLFISIFCGNIKQYHYTISLYNIIIQYHYTISLYNIMDLNKHKKTNIKKQT
jgi:hypothetical protein